MDKSACDRRNDTNMIELKRTLTYLVANGYEFDGIRETFDGMRYYYPDDAVASFSKKISYSDAGGDWINDSSMKVSVQFEKRSDYTNFKKNEEGDDVYIGNPHAFIMGLIEEIK